MGNRTSVLSSRVLSGTIARTLSPGFMISSACSTIADNSSWLRSLSAAPSPISGCVSNSVDISLAGLASEQPENSLNARSSLRFLRVLCVSAVKDRAMLFERRDAENAEEAQREEKAQLCSFASIVMSAFKRREMGQPALALPAAA